MAELPDRSDTTRLIEQAVRGDQQALGKLLSRHRERLRRMVALRLDWRLRGRVDPSDVLQEACLDAARRLPEYRKNPTMPFFLWLRFLAGQRLVDEHRKHLGPPAATPAARSASTMAPCPRRAPPRWRPNCSGASPRRARPPSGRSGRSASRRRSSGWTRLTARSWPCATSRS